MKEHELVERTGSCSHLASFAPESSASLLLPLVSHTGML